MKRFSLFLVLATLLFCACDSDTVKVRGEVEGLNGTVKLLAEMPGEPGLTILAQQEVKDGKIDLRTDQFKIPGRVWVDIDGKATYKQCEAFNENRRTIVFGGEWIFLNGFFHLPDIHSKRDAQISVYFRIYGCFRPVSKKGNNTNLWQLKNHLP